MTLDELKSGPKKTIVLINPPVVVIDRIQLDFYADAMPFGLYQIRTWLKNHGHSAHVFDMMGYGKHRMDFNELIERGELLHIARLRTGAESVDFDAYLYGLGVDALERWFDGLGSSPDEIWVSCSILFNAFLAHAVIKKARERFPEALIRIGGGYPSLSPDHAAKSGAIVVSGRLHEVDTIQPDLPPGATGQHFALFRLTSGCPNKCAFCINGRERMHRFPVDDVIDYVRRTYRKSGIVNFNNWDPNVLRFRPHFKAFLLSAAQLEEPVRFRFDMGLEPDMLDEEIAALLRPGKVEAFTIPLESVNPDFAEFFNKPYTVVSSIRALERLRAAGVKLDGCHGTYIIGYPDERLEDVFTVFHIIQHYGMQSTPFPIVVLPHSPVFERYGHLLQGRRFREYNGHLFPLIDDPERVRLYRRLVHLLAASSRRVADHAVQRLPEAVQRDYFSAAEKATRIIDLVRRSDELDGLDLLRRVYAKAGFQS